MDSPTTSLIRNDPKYHFFDLRRSTHPVRVKITPPEIAAIPKYRLCCVDFLNAKDAFPPNDFEKLSTQPFGFCDLLYSNTPTVKKTAPRRIKTKPEIFLVAIFHPLGKVPITISQQPPHCLSKKPTMFNIVVDC